MDRLYRLLHGQPRKYSVFLSSFQTKKIFDGPYIIIARWFRQMESHGFYLQYVFSYLIDQTTRSPQSSRQCVGLLACKARVRAPGQTSKQNTKSISSAISSQQISGNYSQKNLSFGVDFKLQATKLRNPKTLKVFSFYHKTCILFKQIQFYVYFLKMFRPLKGWYVLV